MIETININNLFEKMEEIVDIKVNSNNNSNKGNGEISDIIVKIFVRHSRIKISKDEEQKIRNVVRASVIENKPIPISLLWAFCGMARSNMKFMQPQINYPRLGDIWAIYWFLILHKKIQKIYQPGLKVFLIDEVQQLLVLGWDNEQLLKRHKIMEYLVKNISNGAVETIKVPYFGKEVLNKISVGKPSDSEIFSILTSIPEAELINEQVVKDLYISRGKSWEEIKNLIPILLWEKALQVRENMNKINEARKETGFIQKVINRPYIDAALTEKTRWCPDIWGFTFPQHGGSLLINHEQGQFSVRIIPETRLEKEKYTPVYISTKDFNFFEDTTKNPEEMYIFYWKPRE